MPMMGKERNTMDLKTRIPTKDMIELVITIPIEDELEITEIINGHENMFSYPGYYRAYTHMYHHVMISSEYKVIGQAKVWDIGARGRKGRQMRIQRGI
jgi:hypothetical protein